MLDAGTQEIFGGAPLIELNGASFSGGLTFQAGSGGSIVRGLVINRFTGTGISIATGSDGNTITGNWIGTDRFGNADLGNSGDGILVNSRTNSISSNVVSGNGGDGIEIGSSGTGNLVTGNYIGTNSTGTGLLTPLNTGNGGGGLNISGSSNIIGGTSAAERNVIAGNGWGISITGASGNVVQGNYIGTNASGTLGLANTIEGVRISGTATGNTIGGTAAGSGNVIASNQTGVLITGTQATGNFVQGNLIGTDATGTIDLGNASDGVLISGGAKNNIVGGTAVGARNVISGNNSNGVDITGTGTTGNIVQGNYIGTSAGGMGDLGNNLDGVHIASSATGNTIGGTTPAARNVISGNGVSGTSSDGIEITGAGSTGNIVQGNYIGVDATGAAPLGNSGTGIRVGSGANFIGGTASGAGNVISGNAVDGIEIAASSGNLVQGNYIGTNASGTTDVGNGQVGIWLNNAANNTIGGAAPGARNVISGNAWSGIDATGTSTGNVIRGNYIGTDLTGNVALQNDAWGIRLAAASNFIGGTGTGDGNLISANGIDGVLVEGSSGNVIQGNYIGTNASGTGDLGNTQVGIWLSNASNNTIGGSVSGARNVISGNAWSGIDVTGSGTGNVIRGNYIGTDQTGSVALQNDAWGIRLASASNLVGGTGPDDGNLISGNGIDGILVDGVSGNLIQGNFIGTDRTGTAAIGNAEDGIWLDNASNTTIGGTVAGTRNVISGNGWNGVALSGSGAGNVIQGNYIGTDKTGSGPLLGNASNAINGVLVEGVGDTTVDDNRILYNAQDGVLVRGASGTTISRNIVTQNFQRGVVIEAGNGNTITTNAIYANGGIGIDLGDDFVTLNDAAPGDLDVGANGLQNYPVLTAAVTNGATVTINGAINSTASTTFRLEFFASSVGDPSGYGEGERYLDTRNVTTDASGNASFTFTLAAAVGFGEAVTATATDPFGNTSEFALNVMTNSVPTNNVPGGLIAIEDIALPINSVSVSDADSNVNSVVLTVLNGWLTATPAGGATVVGSGTANVTITGAQADINLTLAEPRLPGQSELQRHRHACGARRRTRAGCSTRIPLRLPLRPQTIYRRRSTIWRASPRTPVRIRSTCSPTTRSCPTSARHSTVTGVTQGASGTVAIVGGTTVTYTPNANFFGADSFTYTISDGNGGTATATSA